MNRLVVWLDRIASSRSVAILFVLELIVLGAENLLMFPVSVPCFRRLTGRDYLDMCAFCSSDQVYAHLEAFGVAGRRMQLLLFATVDVVIPTLSGFFGVLGIAHLIRPRRAAQPRLALLTLVPLAAMSLDFTENALIALVTIQFPARLDVVAAAAGLTTGMKTIAYGATALVLVTLALMRARGQPASRS